MRRRGTLKHDQEASRYGPFGLLSTSPVTRRLQAGLVGLATANARSQAATDLGQTTQPELAHPLQLKTEPKRTNRGPSASKRAYRDYPIRKARLPTSGVHALNARGIWPRPPCQIGHGAL